MRGLVSGIAVVLVLLLVAGITQFPASSESMESNLAATPTTTANNAVTPTVRSSHIIIIPDIAIEVLSFSGSGSFSELPLDLPENARLLNISGSVKYSDVELEGNRVILKNVSVVNESHLALEYSFPGNFFGKKISVYTVKLLILIPTTYEVLEKSENLVFSGKAFIGQNDYSIFEAKDLSPGDEVRLKFGEHAVQSTQDQKPTQHSQDQKPNLAFFAGILLIVAGFFLLVFSRSRKSWEVGGGEEREENGGKGWEI